jgi:Domain of unknown function (DUF4336)
MLSFLSHANPTFPPLDVLKPVADEVWIVDSGPHRVLGLELPVRMTVVRLAGGFLWLHSPTRMTEDLKLALDRLGPVRHLVAPNVAHWSYLRDWQQTYPMAVTWAAPGLQDRAPVRKAGVRVDHELGDAAPADWVREIVQVVVPGAGFREVAFLHQPTRTLLLTDLMLNLEPAKMPLLLRPLAKALGLAGSGGQPARYVRFAVSRKREEAVQAVSRMIAWEPDRVIFSHGRWFPRDGTAALRRGFAWLLP